ncbi:MAG: serine/threonine-protein kinase [Burkholderiales bacterium]
MELVESLGVYAIVSELGRGTTGTVFRAKDPNVEREVAIKMLLPSFPDAVRERYMRDVRAACRLNHRNIVSIFDVAKQDGIVYLAMELVEGRSLQKMLRAPERMTFDKAAEIAAQLAEALDYAHRLSVVHRDLKPANVMFDAAGRVKLTDFVVITATGRAQAGASIASHPYWSPEQIRGELVDARSNVLSLGVVLYEMLARRAPFNGAANDSYPPLRELDSTIPVALERIVDKALTRNPDGRYQRAAEMASDLRSLHPRAPATAPAAATSNEVADLLGDLDAFSNKLDADQQDLDRKAEDEARLKRDEEQRRIAAATAVRREQEEIADPTASPTEAPKKRALDMLRSVPAAAPVENPVIVRRRNVAALNQAMRIWEKYFAEFMHEMSARCPPVAKAYALGFFGTLPKVTLAEGWIDTRPRSIDGEDCLNHIVLRYRVNPEVPAKLMLFRDDIAPCENYLKGLQAVFAATATTKNDFGQIVKSEITLTGGPMCEIRIEADYDAFTVDLNMINVRQLGRRGCHLPTADFAGRADDLASYLLGADDEFEKQLTPAK